MSLSITEIARMHKQFIFTHLNELEQALLPSSEEDQELVRRAIFSVRNKSVIFERYVPFSGNLYTIVQDVKSPQVIIEFIENKITCSCPATGHCRHELAVLLSLYQYFDSVQEWTNTWRAKKSIEMSDLAKERTPENWLLLVDEVMKPHLHPNKHIEGYAILNIADTGRNRLYRYLPFEREWVPLYKLFVELSMFIHIMRHYSATSYHDYNQQYYLEYYADKAIEKMQSLIQEVSQQSKLFSMDLFYDELQKMALDCLLLPTNYESKQLSVYLMFWRKIFTETSRYEKELREIQLIKENISEKDSLLKPIQVLFHMLLNNMHEIDLLLKRIDIASIDHYLSIVQIANETGHQKVAAKILYAILPYLDIFIKEMVRPVSKQQFANKLDALYANVELTDEEEMLLYNSFGKYGVFPFSLYLIRKKRFSDWASLHQLHPSSLAYLESCGLKTVLEEAPEAALPLLHHFAMEELAQKSRVHYKQAVKIWKKMRTAAKKAGKTTFFEEYMNIFRTDYKRLRALQEELDKGNL